MIINDGTGSGNNAKVNEHNMLRVYAETETEASHESEAHGNCYSWTHAYNYDAADTILWLRNDHTSLNLIIDKIIVAGDTATQFTVHSPADTIAAGTAVTGVNLNRGSGKVALATAKGDETGNTQANEIANGFIGANGSAVLPLEGTIILGYLDELAVDIVTAGTMGAVTIRAYYHEFDV